MRSKSKKGLLNNRLNFLFELIASSINHLIYFTLVLGMVFALWHDSHQSIWLILSVLLLSLMMIQGNFTHRLFILFLTGMGAATFAFCAGCLAANPFPLAIYLFILTTMMIYLSQQFPQYYCCFFMVNFLSVLSGGWNASFYEMVIRLLYILLGLVIVLLMQVIFYIRFIHSEGRWWIILSLWQLRKLNVEIFSCFIDSAYPENIYRYERRLHMQKHKCLKIINHLRQIVSDQGSSHFFYKQQIQLFQKQWLNIFDLLLDCSQLRRRVSDHATFIICVNELTAICQEIDKLFKGLIAINLNKKLFPNINMLQEKIYRLEENYNHVLQISAPEPLVFLLFISSLKALSNEILKCYEIWIK